MVHRLGDIVYKGIDGDGNTHGTPHTEIFS